MKVLDLFAGAGGAGRGYALGGAEVTGVDTTFFKRNPNPLIKADVLSLDPRWLRRFDLIHASPPCQAHTALRGSPGTKVHVDLIPATRALLQASGVPYVIENVVGAPLIKPVTLCGCMFELGAQGCKLERKRLFECSFEVQQPTCRCHLDPRPVIGVYGGHARKRAAKAGGRGTMDVWEGGHLAAASEAMGIDWMTLSEISQAIPPDYTSYICHWYKLRQL